MRRIAMFGGTFNPIHMGHIALASAAAKAADAQVLLIPTCIPPHKSHSDLLDGRRRLEMCRLAAADYPFLSVSDMELKREGSSYTVDTLYALREAYPDATLYLTCGADMLVTLHQWRRYEEIIRLAGVIAVQRPGTDPAAFSDAVDQVERDGGRVLSAEMEPISLSSSEIRRRLAGNLSVEGMVPPRVAAYIAAYHLYKDNIGNEKGKGADAE